MSLIVLSRLGDGRSLIVLFRLGDGQIMFLLHVIIALLSYFKIILISLCEPSKLVQNSGTSFPHLIALVDYREVTRVITCRPLRLLPSEIKILTPQLRYYVVF